MGAGAIIVLVNFLSYGRQNVNPASLPSQGMVASDVLGGPPQEAAVNREKFANPALNAKSSEKASSSPRTTFASRAICTGADSSNFDCYENYYTKLVEEKGIAAAVADIRKRYAANSYVYVQCHPLMHVIGRAASERFGNPGDAFAEGDSFCWSGYYHGVMEGIIGRIGLKNLASQMNRICVNIRDRTTYGFDYYNCVHGLGHGLMAITQDELFQSLDWCGKLAGSWEQASCASGIFMENIIIDGKNHKTKYLRADEPLYPCMAVEEKYKYPCYLMQSSYVLKVVGADFVKIFEWCEKADPDYRKICYQSIGRDASGNSIADIERTRNSCLLGKPGDEQENCAIGAVKDFISYYHSDKKAKELCNSFAAENLRSVCLETAEQYYKAF